MNGARTLAAGAFVAALLAMGGVARGQVFHQYPGAPVVGDTSPNVGTLIGFGDDMLRLLGYGRFNVSEVSDFGIEIVLDRFDPAFVDEGWRIGAAADYRYAIVPDDTELPFDISVGGGLGVQTGADVTNLNIPVGAIISRPLQLRDDRVMVPYGGVYLVFTHWSYDLPPGSPDHSDSDFDVELRLGASIQVIGGLSGFANVHVGAGDMFALGVNASL